MTAQSELRILKLREEKAKQKKIAEYRQLEDERYRSLEPASIRIYETQKDKEALSLANPRMLNQLRNFLDSLTSMKKGKALEVACGAGWVTKEVLLSRFSEVDLFDQCEQAKDDAKENIGKNPKLGQLRVQTM